VAPINAAELTTEGIDLQIDYRWELPPVMGWPNALSLGFVGNKSIEYGYRADPASDFIECQGFFGLPCNFSSTGSNPEYRANTTLAYTLGDAQVSVIWRWIDEMVNAGRRDAFFDGLPLVERADSQSYVDLNARLELGEAVTLYAGVRNLTDQKPPLLGLNAQQSNTNPNLYDVLGRRFRLGVQVRL
jgi:outer membrane receptor protein involved in Fe transport